MFRQMRRYKQLLPQDKAIEILERGNSGVLALRGDEDYPYAVPLSYVYNSGKIYFHGAKEGHKLDAMRKNPKASFCVIDMDEIAPKEYTTYYKSVIAFGKIRILEDEDEIKSACGLLGIKYSPKDSAENRNRIIEKHLKNFCIFVLETEHLTGKQAKELIK